MSNFAPFVTRRMSIDKNTKTYKPHWTTCYAKRKSSLAKKWICELVYERQNRK